MTKPLPKDKKTLKTKTGYKEKKIVQWLIIFFVLTAGVLSLIGDKGFLRLMSLKKQEAKLREEIEELKHEKKIWLNKIYSLKNNTTYIETVAREELGMIDQNEILLEIRYYDDPF